PHPVIRHPATMMATGRQTPLLVHRMLVLSLVANLRPALAPVSERGQRGKAEVLERLGIGGLAACEKRRLAQVLYGRVAGREQSRPYRPPPCGEPVRPG